MQRNAQVFLEVANAVAGHLHNGKVLDDDGVGAGFLHGEHLPVCRLQFIII